MNLKENPVVTFCMVLAHCTLTSLESIVMLLEEYLPTDAQLREFFVFVGARPENLNPVTRWWLSQTTNDLRAGAMRLL